MRSKWNLSFVAFVISLTTQNKGAGRGVINGLLGGSHILSTETGRRQVRTPGRDDGPPTFSMLQHQEHRLLRDDVLVQTHHVGHTAGDDGLSVPAGLAAFPQTLTENKKVSCTLSCLWSLLCSVFINQTNLSELLRASEKPLICCSMPLGPWRLR